MIREFRHRSCHIKYGDSHFIPLILAICLLLLMNGNIFASNSLVAHIEAYSGKPITVYALEGANSRAIVQLKTNREGNFRLPLDSFPTGLYRFSLENKIDFDMILSPAEAVEFSFKYPEPLETMQIAKSAENKQFYYYLTNRSLCGKKINMMHTFFADYPDTTFSNELKPLFEQENNRIEQEAQQAYKKALAQNPQSFAGKYLACYNPAAMFPDSLSTNEQYAFINSHSPEKIAYYRKNFWKHFAFDDARLLHSPAYYDLVRLYFDLTANDSIHSSYSNAADDVMQKIQDVDDKIYSTVFEYVMMVLDLQKQGETQARLITEYGDNCALENIDNATLQKRIKSQLKLIKVSKAPNFTATTVEGKEITLSAMPTERTAVIFFASWCPHCQATIPEIINNPAFNVPDISLIFVSIDTDAAALRSFVASNNLAINTRWHVVCDLQGFNGAVASDYAVTSIPQGYVVDRELTIVNKLANGKFTDY